MIGSRIKINLIFFLVGSLGLSYLMANQVLTILQERYSVYAIFPDAGGVFTNQEVTYRGITVDPERGHRSSGHVQERGGRAVR
jgi:phospholipid/cholesterol/gamma-HCH transport system substrate-binding protein